MKLSGLWRHADFLRLWSGQTISVFGSMIGGTALSFTAILFLHATPAQLGLLGAMQIAPALLAGLFAVNATIRSLGLAAVLAGSLLGGFLAQLLSVRLMLAVAASCTLAAAGTLALSPVRSLKEC